MNASFSCPRTCPLHNERWCRFRGVLDSLGPVKVSSHVATIRVEIRDLDALAIACERLGLEFVRGQTTYKWWGISVGDHPLPEGYTADDLGKCLHAIRVKGDTQAYEIGVVLNRDGSGSYGLIWDFFSGGYGLEEKVGAECNRLVSEYQVAVVEQQAKSLGWLYERTGNDISVFHPQGGVIVVKNGKTAEASGFVGTGCHEAAMALSLKYESMNVLPEYGQVAAKVQVGA